LREETKKKFCQLLVVGLEEAFQDLVKAADEKRHTDFWQILENMAKLLDMEERVKCEGA